MLGQEIETIVDNKQMIGPQEILWNSSNYPGGVYVYQLITDGLTQKKKLLALK